MSSRFGWAAAVAVSVLWVPRLAHAVCGDGVLDAGEGCDDGRLLTLTGQSVFHDHTDTSPRSLTFDAAGVVYLSESDTDQVHLLDAAGAVSGAIAFGSRPGFSALSPGGFLFASLAGTDEVVVVDTAAGSPAPVPLVTSLSGPQGLAVSSDGSTLYVADRTLDVVRRFDLPGADSPVDIVTGLDDPRGVALSPDGTRLYLAEHTRDEVMVVQLDAGSPAPTSVLNDPGSRVDGPWGVAFGPDGALYVVNRSVDGLLRFDFAANDFEEVLAAGTFDSPRDVAFDAAGAMYVSESVLGVVLRYETRGNSDVVADACRSDCSLAGCGDGVVDMAEACDEGAFNGTTACGCAVGCGFVIADTACGSPAGDCLGPDVCNGSGRCVRGSPLAEGTGCGDPNPTECSDADSCDGAGACSRNDLPDGTACGDTRNDECRRPDRCDGAGTCAANDLPDGTSCDDGRFCNGDESCQSAECVTSAAPCRDGEVCDEDADQCYGPCGDGEVAGSEECDDANSSSGDGCSATCREESGYACAGEPSVCRCTGNACGGPPGGGGSGPGAGGASDASVGDRDAGEPSDASAPRDAGSSGGTSGGNGGGGRGGGLGARGGDGEPPGSDGDAGCDCRVPGAPSQADRSWWLVVAALLPLISSRRRRRGHRRRV